MMYWLLYLTSLYHGAFGLRVLGPTSPARMVRGGCMRVAQPKYIIYLGPTHIHKSTIHTSLLCARDVRMNTLHVLVPVCK